MALGPSPFAVHSPADKYGDMNPQVITHETDVEAEADARSDVALTGGKLYKTGGTPSMEPLITGQVYMVAKKKDYKDLKKGEIVNYTPKWANGDTVVHRLVQKDKDGWIASGDNNPRSESWERVTEQNYLDSIVKIHTYKGAEKTRKPRH